MPVLPAVRADAARLDPTLVRWLWAVGLLSLCFRAWWSATLPMTGDEALFYWWARFPDYGYYDHPPMVAWWIMGARALWGDAAWAIRVPMLLLPLGVGWAIWWAWSPVDRTRAAWAVLLYWLMPMNWLNALMTTDSPLILFAAWSVAALVRAERQSVRGRPAWGLYALSGVAIGLAFLSKYFAVLLGLAYLVYFAGWARARWRGLLVLVACGLPAAILNLWWNLDHCWTNIMFNVFNRNEDADFGLDKVGAYVATLLYLLGPVWVWCAWRARGRWRAAWQGHALLVCVAVVPLACFALMAGRKVIGLHWLLAFYPFLIALLTWLVPAERLAGVRRGLAWFLGLHLVLVLGIAQTNLSQWQSFKHYKRVVEAVRAPELVRQVAAPDVVLMAHAYSAASLYGHAAGVHVPVFGLGSFHARQDDLVVDYSRFDGRTIRVLRTSAPAPGEYEPFFASVRTWQIVQDGQPFHVIEGRGFDYVVYRERVLREVNRRYYAFPSWLPVRGCVFCERLCGAPRCAP